MLAWLPMRLAFACAALTLICGCRERAHRRDLAQAHPARDAGNTVIIEFPPPPIDAHGVDYAAPLYIDPSAPPGTRGNGKPAPRNTAPDAAPRDEGAGLP